jgi:hypothetical protein
LSVRRGTALLAVFASLALAVVHLRAEQTRSASSVLRMESEWVRLRSELWGVQTRMARARAPDRIHDRATYLATGLVPPGTKEEIRKDAVERLAAATPIKRSRPATNPAARRDSRSKSLHSE